jgi:hypothetical protein
LNPTEKTDKITKSSFGGRTKGIQKDLPMYAQQFFLRGTGGCSPVSFSRNKEFYMVCSRSKQINEAKVQHKQKNNRQKLNQRNRKEN